MLRVGSTLAIVWIHVLSVVLTHFRMGRRDFFSLSNLLPLLSTFLVLCSFLWLAEEDFSFLVLLPWLLYSYPIALIDSKTKRIPNNLNFLFASTQSVALVFYCLIKNSAIYLVSVLYGISYLLLFLILNLLTRDKIGFGDVKLAYGIGLVTSLVDLRVTIVSFGLSFLLASFLALMLLLSGKIKRKDKLAFAPFMFMGSACAIFW